MGGVVRECRAPPGTLLERARAAPTFDERGGDLDALLRIGDGLLPVLVPAVRQAVRGSSRAMSRASRTRGISRSARAPSVRVEDVVLGLELDRLWGRIIARQPDRAFNFARPSRAHGPRCTRGSHRHNPCSRTGDCLPLSWPPPPSLERTRRGAAVNGYTHKAKIFEQVASCSMAL